MQAKMSVADGHRHPTEKTTGKDSDDGEKRAWDGVPTCPAPVAAPDPAELPHPAGLWKL
jgi:hypothetical protein